MTERIEIDRTIVAPAADIFAVLTDLRRLETIATRAVRGSQSAPEVFKALGIVRGRYDELMTRAARAPSATLGCARVYVVSDTA